MLVLKAPLSFDERCKLLRDLFIECLRRLVAEGVVLCYEFPRNSEDFFIR